MTRRATAFAAAAIATSNGRTANGWFGDAGESGYDGPEHARGTGQDGARGAPASAAARLSRAERAGHHLTFPLASLLGLAERPGTGYGLGPLDPALVRDLATAAASSPRSDWCPTITGTNGQP